MGNGEIRTGDQRLKRRSMNGGSSIQPVAKRTVIEILALILRRSEMVGQRAACGEAGGRTHGGTVRPSQALSDLLVEALGRVRIRGGFRPMDGPGGFSAALRANIPPSLLRPESCINQDFFDL